jgi:alkanesulfonate monooxygenase SsuD/methylene tetrahydromethanopterin reductase-like flavin-dependent oxidoreductase (luciferase family)/predicted kinase
MTVAFPDPVLVVLVGAAGSGKTTWAAANFAANQIVSSDALRATVGQDEADLGASTDAFSLLRQIVEMRAQRRLTTVIDTLGFDADLRAAVRQLGLAYRLPVHVVVFDAPVKLLRAWNRQRTKAVPARVIDEQARRMAEMVPAVEAEPFDQHHVIRQAPMQDRTSPGQSPTNAGPSGSRVRFGLHLSTFPWPAAEHRARLTEVAQAAEAAGFDSLWAMDHFRQIPQIGRAWDDMHEVMPLLAHLAAVTERVTVGSLVAAVTHRNIAVFGKAMASLDVLSGGRAVCGVGLGWFAAEHAGYGIEFPPVKDRYRLLEDALRSLPILWGKGAPAFEGNVFSAAELMAYPRPLAGRVPLLVGGGGERRTLRLAAQYADACNLFGSAEQVAHKVKVLHQHAHELGRDPSGIEVTHLTTVIAGTTPRQLAENIAAMPKSPQRANTIRTGTVVDQARSIQELFNAGATHQIVSTPVMTPEHLEVLGTVISESRSAIG